MSLTHRHLAPPHDSSGTPQTHVQQHNDNVPCSPLLDVVHCPVLGLLTGLSYVSGVDYYKAINEQYCATAPAGTLIPHNPPVLLYSLDCAPYALACTERRFDDVIAYILQGVHRLAPSCDFLCFASNTAHMAFPAVRKQFPHLPVLHIADSTALALKEKNIDTVGLLGTNPTMTESYLKDRIAKHGIKTIVPDKKEDLDRIFVYILRELSFGQFTEDCIAFFVQQIKLLKERGAQGIILGCTEIELLDLQPLVTIPLFPSAKLHIQAIVDVQVGRKRLEDYTPDE